MSSRRRTKTDPELQRQLDAAKESGGHVEAVLTLRGGPGTSGDAETVANQVLRRVESAVGMPVDDYNVLGNLGIVVIAAPEQFVTAVLDQPEIESASANEVAPQ